jgi:chromosome segregation ATPase
MTPPNFSLEPLPSRMLFSHWPLACPQVAEARQALRAITAELRQDRGEAFGGIAALRDEITDAVESLCEENGDEVRAAVDPLRGALAELVTTQREQQRDGSAAIAEIEQAWQPTIQAHQGALRRARESGDAHAVAAAQQKLETDRAALQADVQPLKDHLEATLTETADQVAAARRAVQDKLAEFSPELAALFEELRAKLDEADRGARAGRKAVVAAQQALRDSIAKCRADHENGSSTLRWLPTAR